jgi:hypothetical protein
MLPVVAVKLALLWPAAIVTLAGTLTFALLLLSVTAVAALAVPAIDTAQDAELFEPRLVGEQESVLNCAGATRFKVLVKETALALAVTTAVWLLLT